MSDDETTETIEREPFEAWSEDDEPDALPPRKRKPGFTPLTGALIALLLLACGFVGGVLVQKGQGGSNGGGGAFAAAAARLTAQGGRTTSQSGPAGGGRFGGGGFGGRGGFGGGAAGGANATIGTVSSVDGNTLYVTDANGNTLKVKAAPSATVRRTVDSKVSAINPGESVVIQGTPRNGAITATSISATPALGGGAGGGAGAGGAGGSALDQLFGGGGRRGG